MGWRGVGVGGKWWWCGGGESVLNSSPSPVANQSGGKSLPIEIKAQLQLEGAHRPQRPDVPGAPAQVTGDGAPRALQDAYYIRALHQDGKM